MNSLMCTADIATHLKIVVTALLAAGVVVSVGIASNISSRPIAELATAPARPRSAPVQPSPAPGEHSMIAMLKNHRL